MPPTNQTTFWNDFLLKNQFSALVSSSTAMKQQNQRQEQQQQQKQQQKKSVIDRLPDEILIHILSQPSIPLNTFGQVLNVSQRMRQTGIYVLSHYRLPAVQLTISIDQEGRNRITSKFELNQLDHVSLFVSMKCTANTPRRYYSNKASPIIRSIIAKDKYTTCCHKVQRSATYMSLQEDDMESLDTCLKNKECNTTITSSSTAEHQQILNTLVSPPITSITHNYIRGRKLVNCKIHSKEGLHTLQIPQGFSLLYNKRLQINWKFNYQISRQQPHTHEYHLLPLSIIMQFNQLLLLLLNDQQQIKDGQENKKWGSRMMSWVMSNYNT